MKITYFQDTDTLYIQFKLEHVTQTRDLDATGRNCAITVEHARERTEVPALSFEQIAA